MPLRIDVKRVHDDPSDDDGYRVLVDRLWPRGIRKEAARLDAWAKDLAPSTELRQWFGHDPDRFDEFAARYRRELAGRSAAVEELRSAIDVDTLTLVYAAADRVHNHAVVLRDHLRDRLA